MQPTFVQHNPQSVLLWQRDEPYSPQAPLRSSLATETSKRLTSHHRLKGRRTDKNLLSGKYQVA